MDVTKKRRINIRHLADITHGRKVLAEKLGYDDTNYVNQLCGGFGNFGNRTARKIEQRLALSHGWMDDLHPDLYNLDTVDELDTFGDTPSANDAQEIRVYHDSRAPIVGNVQLDPDGWWTKRDYPPGENDGFVHVPPGDPEVYALRVRGDSMAPTIRNGWLAVVEPNSETHPGEFVLVCTCGGRCSFKELRYERDNEYTFGSINENHPAITLQKSDITRLHPVFLIAPPSAARQ